MNQNIFIILIFLLDFIPYLFLYSWFSDYSGWMKFSLSNLLFTGILFYTVIFLYALPIFLILLFITRFFWNTMKFVRFLPALGLCMQAFYHHSSLLTSKDLGLYYLSLWYIIGIFYHLFFAALMLYVSLRVSESDVAERLTDHS